MLISVVAAMQVEVGVRGILRWLVGFYAEICKTEITVGDTVVLALILKSVMVRKREPEY